MSNEQLLNQIIGKRLQEAGGDDEAKRKAAVCDLEKLYKLESERRKNDAETVRAYVQIFGVPLMGVGLLIGYRLMMETDIPDIFARDVMGKLIAQFAFKKV